jgi:hypothetical protein
MIKRAEILAADIMDEYGIAYKKQVFFKTNDNRHHWVDFVVGNVAIEVDELHHKRAKVMVKDIERQKRLEDEYGLTFVRINGESASSIKEGIALNINIIKCGWLICQSVHSQTTDML